MTETIERSTTEDLHQAEPPLRQYVVWIDTNCGFGPPDWEMDSPPQPLKPALDEARAARLAGFPAMILLEGQTPRADGLFSNPRTDP